MKNKQSAATFETFRNLVFLYSDTLYSDASCLTDCQEDLTNLVVATYIRVYLVYKQYRKMKSLALGSILAQLYQTLHAAFCAGIRRNHQDLETEIGTAFEH